MRLRRYCDKCGENLYIRQMFSSIEAYCPKCGYFFDITLDYRQRRDILHIEDDNTSEEEKDDGTSD